MIILTPPNAVCTCPTADCYKILSTTLTHGKSSNNLTINIIYTIVCYLMYSRLTVVAPLQKGCDYGRAVVWWSTLM
jgi:hypothetical protein